MTKCRLAIRRSRPRLATSRRESSRPLTRTCGPTPRPRPLAYAEDIGRAEPALIAAAAVTYGKDRNFEREAVVDERDVLRDALNRSMGDVRVAEVKADFEQRVGARGIHRQDATAR